MNCCNCKKEFAGKKMTCDILCSTTYNKIKVIELCGICFNKMMDDEEKFLKLLKIPDPDFYLEVEMQEI